jgi:hypothetical protein
MEAKCPVCNSSTLTSSQQQQLSMYLECPGCGAYSLTLTALATLPGALKLDDESKRRAKLSHAIFKMSRGGKWVQLSDELIRAILQDASLPLPSEQLDNLITWIGNSQGHPGARVDVGPSAVPAIGAIDPSGFGFIADQALKRGLVDCVIRVITPLGQHGVHYQVTPMQLTLAGWNRFEELRRGRSISRIAFMAMPFGREDLDQIYRDHFQRAVADTGFTLKRLDENQPAGLIDDRLRVEIRQCRFLIADLTHNNAGAYWEAGYAEGLGKPVIYTCERSVFDDKKTGTHFDTNHHLTVVWDPTAPELAVTKLKATIRATLPDEARLSD